MSKRRDPKLVEAFGDNLRASYLQGYQDGLEEKCFDPQSIVMTGREHLFGYAYMQGWHDGREDASDE